MYVGRIVSVARMTDGRLCAAYRVSSRSFPNRTAVVTPDKVSIVPKAGHETDVHRNPYIAYNCVRIVRGGAIAVVSNGSQTDAIAEKIAMGMPVRDALAMAMLALDYEKDQYNTPRISAVIDKAAEAGWLSVVRHDGLEVRRMPLELGRLFYVATYEENHVTTAQGDVFDAQSAEETCAFLLGRGVFATRDNPVTAVAAVGSASGFDLHAQDTGAS